jgi:peptidoglycan/xylan/chitin deacetylase (PgdA/CDA1 family)
MSTTTTSESISSRAESNSPREIFILNLHGIGTPRQELPASENNVWITESQFEMLLDSVKDRVDVELTFDDSNESDFTIALPALRRRAMRAQFFVVAGRVGQPGYLSQSQLAQLIAAGMKIGSHGMSHRPWTGLDDIELNEELVEARERLEQFTGVTIDRAACPFGSYNRRVLQQLRSAGFKCVYTSDGGTAQPDSFLQPRTSVSRNVDQESLTTLLSARPSGAAALWRQLKLAIKRSR